MSLIPNVLAGLGHATVARYITGVIDGMQMIPKYTFQILTTDRSSDSMLVSVLRVFYIIASSIAYAVPVLHLLGKFLGFELFTRLYQIIPEGFAWTVSLALQLVINIVFGHVIKNGNIWGIFQDLTAEPALIAFGTLIAPVLINFLFKWLSNKVKFLSFLDHIASELVMIVNLFFTSFIGAAMRAMYFNTSRMTAYFYQDFFLMLFAPLISIVNLVLKLLGGSWILKLLNLDKLSSIAVVVYSVFGVLNDVTPSTVSTLFTKVLTYLMGLLSPPSTVDVSKHINAANAISSVSNIPTSLAELQAQFSLAGFRPKDGSKPTLVTELLADAGSTAVTLETAIGFVIGLVRNVIMAFGNRMVK